HPYCGDDSEKRLVPVPGEDFPVFLEHRCASLLELLLKRVKAGERIVPVSGWRSRTEQRKIYEDTAAEKGLAFTEKYVARPGHSEHQTGLAIDLAERKPSIDFVCPDFPYHGICQEFRRQAPAWGFIERYPRDKEAVTGIGWEPWHFRYVGFPHALIMSREALALEEYHVFLKEHPWGRPLVFETGSHWIEISYIEALPGGRLPPLSLPSPHLISGNNVDGFVATVWRQKA
ncbi:MAG: M15 family metallopeptidase, partial [Bacillota bacterium]|nr:M15 family metallopeptidase [Bacillota bacterium]